MVVLGRIPIYSVNFLVIIFKQYVSKQHVFSILCSNVEATSFPNYHLQYIYGYLSTKLHEILAVSNLIFQKYKL